MKATNERNVNAIPAGKKDRLPAALWALALCLFAFGTGESVVPGLLLKIASDLKVSTSRFGLNAVPLVAALVTAVAISVTTFSWSLDFRTRLPVRTAPA